jgi:hypothetical protein
MQTLWKSEWPHDSRCCSEGMSVSRQIAQVSSSSASSGSSGSCSSGDDAGGAERCGVAAAAWDIFVGCAGFLLVFFFWFAGVGEKTYGVLPASNMAAHSCQYEENDGSRYSRHGTLDIEKAESMGDSE